VAAGMNFPTNDLKRVLFAIAISSLIRKDIEQQRCHSEELSH
jgi:hypothetical protein